MKTRSTRLRPRALIACSLLFVLPATIPAKEEWLPLVPANPVAVISIKSVPELVADWDKSSIGGFLADPAVQKWLAPSFEDGVAPWDKIMLDENGATLREDMGNYPGASMAAFFWPEQVRESTIPAVLEMSEAAGKEEALTASGQRKFEIKMRQNGDLKVFTTEIEGESVSYLAENEEDDTPWEYAQALVGGVYLAANDRAVLTQTISSLKNGGAGEADGLTANFKRFQELSDGAGDLTIYFDAGVLLEKLTAMMATGAEEAAEANPFGLEMFLGALGLDEIRGFGLSLDLRDDASQVDFALLHKENPQSLLVRLMHGVDTRIDLPAFVPADAAGASVSRWSFLRLYDDLFTALNKLGPMIGGMVQMQLGAMEQEMGIKLRDDVFATTDDQLVQISTVTKGDGAGSDVTGIKLKDPARFSAALETLKGLAGNGLGVFEESEFAGFKVWKMKASLPGLEAAGGASEFAYTVAKDYLLVCVGAPDALHKVLNRMKNPSGPALWDEPAARAAMDALPGNRTSIGVTDGSVLVKTLVKAIAQAQETMGAQVAPKGKGKGKGKAKAGGDALVDLNTMPGDEVFSRYFGISASSSYSLPDAAHARIVAQPAAGR